MPTPFKFALAEKSEKKDIKRFYRQQHYSARFIGLDSCYLIKLDNKIIASVIHSQLFSTNEQNLLHALVVDKDHRQQKLASQLISYSCSQHPLTVCFADISLSTLYLGVGFKIAPLNVLSANLAPRYLRYQQTSPGLTIFIRK